MSAWNELATLGVTIRPFAGPKPPSGERYSPFSASLTSTVNLLADELRHLEAHQVVIELEIRERDIRLDGLPRADARPPDDAVALSFQSKHGPLRYATAEYIGRWRQPGWYANLRAIALSMEALRAVDRHGVSKRGEQYQGWRQLEQHTGLTMDAQAAKALLDSYGGEKAALHATHPDTGGTTEAFLRVQAARRTLAAART